jgi:redox-sensitive bicupin YhaK (pirin superfamily)
VVQGAVQVGGHALKAGDGVAVSGESSVTIVGQGRGEVLLFDLP